VRNDIFLQVSQNKTTWSPRGVNNKNCLRLTGREVDGFPKKILQRFAWIEKGIADCFGLDLID
jgi:hypothetical protein